MYRFIYRLLLIIAIKLLLLFLFNLEGGFSITLGNGYMFSGRIGTLLLAALVLLLVVSGVFWALKPLLPAAKKTRTGKQAQQRANRLALAWQRGDLETAHQLMKKTTARDGNTSLPFVPAVHVLLKRGCANEALALVENSHLPKLDKHLFRARIAAEGEDNALFAEEAQQAWKLAPANRKAFFLVLEALTGAGRFEEARCALNSAPCGLFNGSGTQKNMLAISTLACAFAKVETNPEKAALDAQKAHMLSPSSFWGAVLAFHLQPTAAHLRLLTQTEVWEQHPLASFLYNDAPASLQKKIAPPVGKTKAPADGVAQTEAPPKEGNSTTQPSAAPSPAAISAVLSMDAHKKNTQADGGSATIRRSMETWRAADLCLAKNDVPALAAIMGELKKNASPPTLAALSLASSLLGENTPALARQWMRAAALMAHPLPDPFVMTDKQWADSILRRLKEPPVFTGPPLLAPLSVLSTPGKLHEIAPQPTANHL